MLREEGIAGVGGGGGGDAVRRDASRGRVGWAACGWKRGTLLEVEEGRSTRKGAVGSVGGWMEGERSAGGGGMAEQMQGEGYA